MPSKYRVTTDQGTFEITTEDPEKPIEQQYATLGGAGRVMAGQAGRAIGAAAGDIAAMPGAIAKTVIHPIDTLTELHQATADAIGRLREAYGKGNYADAAQAAVGAIPAVGPQAEQIVSDIRQGRGAEAIGHAAAARLAIEAPGMLGKVPAAAEAVKAAATKAGPLKVAANAVEAVTHPGRVLKRVAGDAVLDRINQALESRKPENIATPPILPPETATAAATLPPDNVPVPPQVAPSGTVSKTPQVVEAVSKAAGITPGELPGNLPVRATPEAINAHLRSIPPDPLASDPAFIAAARVRRGQTPEPAAEPTPAPSKAHAAAEALAAETGQRGTIPATDTQAAGRARVDPTSGEIIHRVNQSALAGKLAADINEALSKGAEWKDINEMSPQQWHAFAKARGITSGKFSQGTIDEAMFLVKKAQRAARAKSAMGDMGMPVQK